jgi:hypothetical protein
MKYLAYLQVSTVTLWSWGNISHQVQGKAETSSLPGVRLMRHKSREVNARNQVAKERGSKKFLQLPAAFGCP